MHTYKGRLSTGLLLIGLLPGFASARVRIKHRPATITEKIEWTWAQRPENPDRKLPNVLLMGDSITRGYYPQVAQKLSGVANCYLFATSASAPSPRLESQLHAYFRMVGVRFDVIHLNNGMHGWAYSDAQYANGLPELVAELRKDAPGAKLIWASTTPVQNDSETDKAADMHKEERHRTMSSGPYGGGATNARVQARNAAASRLMRADHIPIDDQYSLMAAHANLHSDNVHYIADGSAIQAKKVVALIVPMLQER